MSPDFEIQLDRLGPITPADERPASTIARLPVDRGG